MIIHIFNSSVVSGPERLVLPSLPLFEEESMVIFLSESRNGEAALTPITYAKELGLRIESIQVESRFDRRAIVELRKKLLALNPSIVHAHDVKPSTYLWLAERGLHKKWRSVSTHHGVLGRPDLKTKIYEFFYAHFILRKLDWAIAVSEQDYMLLKKRGLRKLSYLPNGITEKTWSREDPAQARELIREGWRKKYSLAISPQTFVFGMLARLSDEKRHTYILDSLKELKQLAPDMDWQLLCYGNGNLADDLQKKTHDLGLQKQVHWLGYEAKAPELLPGFDLLIFSSNAEGLPIAALEAGWARVPLFATAVGELPQIIGKGENAGGFFFPKDTLPHNVANALLQLCLDRKQLIQLGVNLYKRVSEKYSASNWVEQMQQLYKAIRIV